MNIRGRIKIFFPNLHLFGIKFSYWITGKIGNQNIMITMYKGTEIILITMLSGIWSFNDGTTSKPKLRYVKDGLIASKMDSFLCREPSLKYCFVYLNW